VRGYATVIASLILFVVLASALSVILAQNIRVSASVAQARQFVDYADQQKSESTVQLISYDWNKDSNVLLLVIKNGSEAVDLNTVYVLADGVLLGRCGELNCIEATPDGKLIPGEEFNVLAIVPFKPYRISVSIGKYGVVSLATELNNWHTGCRYRRLVLIRNPASSALSSFQVPVDLDANFDYTHATSTNILITGPDGITELPFWVEYWDVSGESRVWTRLNIPANDSNYVFLYYGCSSVPSYSPSDVFLDDIPNLVAYWPLDENSGNVAHDLSGNGHDMNIYGATWVSGYRGSGIYLDGGTDSYLIANPFNGFPSDTITALFWMETNDTTDTGVPISYASSSTPDDFALMNYQNLRIYVAGNYRIPGLAFNDGVWHGIAATWRSTDGNVEIFDNSSLAYTNTLSEGNTITDGGSFVVGQDQDSVGGGFDASQAFIGTIDEILLFSSVLTASQVQDIYDENYFVSKYYPGHLLIRKNDPGVSVDLRPVEAYSEGINK